MFKHLNLAICEITKLIINIYLHTKSKTFSYIFHRAKCSMNNSSPSECKLIQKNGEHMGRGGGSIDLSPL